MARFTDSNGGVWVMKLKVGHRKALADLGIGFKVSNFGEAMGSFVDSCSDPDKLAAVIDLISVEKPPGATAETLAESMGGDDWERASVALTDEVIDFFHHGRPALAEAARSAVRQTIAEQDRLIANELTRSLSAGNSPESPESTPPT